jgi:hypothetical protein
MTNISCNDIRPLLVDYSDNELPADQARQVSDHLSQCDTCREELHLLDRSLELAREMWREESFQGESPETLPSPFGRGAGGEGRSLLWIGGSLAVCIVVILAVLLQTFFMRSKLPGNAPQTIASAEGNSTQPKEEIDAMEYIAREARSARLAASVELLAAQPGLESYKEHTERYMKETYPDTSAVRKLSKQ